MEVINWKENKEVGTICFEIRIRMKTQKIAMDFFSIKIMSGFNNLILKATKNYLSSKHHTAIGLKQCIFLYFEIQFFHSIDIKAFGQVETCLLFGFVMFSWRGKFTPENSHIHQTLTLDYTKIYALSMHAANL